MGIKAKGKMRAVHAWLTELKDEYKGWTVEQYLALQRLNKIVRKQAQEA